MKRIFCTLIALSLSAPLWGGEETKMDDWKTKPESYWKEKLSPEQFEICRKKGTERAFSGKYWDNHEKGIYRCIACGLELFSSETKFDSGTGWPSFWQALKTENVELKSDNSLFMKRTEVLCKRCGCHLGHVFNDGPAPTHQRFCMNSASLAFVKDETKPAAKE